MFTLKKQNENSALDTAIDKALLELMDLRIDTDEYANAADQLTKLYKLKEINKPSTVSPDNVALIIGNLAGILLILEHERAHVVTSKALSFVMKLR